MKATIYQIPGNSPDFREYAYEDYASAARKYGALTVPRSRYREAAQLILPDKTTPEDIFARLQGNAAAEHYMRSLSVSDLIEIRRKGKAPELLFCDSVGFREVSWDE